jgi:hypothetical protein
MPLSALDEVGRAKASYSRTIQRPARLAGIRFADRLDTLVNPDTR